LRQIKTPEELKAVAPIHHYPSRSSHHCETYAIARTLPTMLTTTTESWTKTATDAANVFCNNHTVFIQLESRRKSREAMDFFTGFN
jgi:hypothetical protein